ncbi:MAG: hypothetical protein HC845_11860 [Akkermansiaceae bacterium]|nr:hypothetical protein [Akkermansiaceae bacterium]
MNHNSKEEHPESCRQRYPSRNRLGRSAMIAKVGEKRKNRLRSTRRSLDPMDLAADIEARWSVPGNPPGVRTALRLWSLPLPTPSTPPAPTENLAKSTTKNQNKTNRRVPSILTQRLPPPVSLIIGAIK